MKSIFLYHVIICSLPIFFCIFFSLIKKLETSKYILWLLISGELTIILYTIKFWIPDTFISTLLSGLYFASLDWLLVLLLSYCVVFDETEGFKNLDKGIQMVLYGINIIDTVSCIANTWTKHVFTQLAIYRGGELYTWEYKFFTTYQIHLIYCYILIAGISGILLTKFFSSLKFYRNKYLFIIIPFLSLILINLLYMIFKWSYDYSILTYGIVVLILWYFSIYGMQREQTTSILSIISENINSAIICFDNKGNYIYSNKKANELFNIDKTNTNNIESYRLKVLSDTMASTSDYFIDEDYFILDNKKHVFSRETRQLRDNKNNIIGSYLKFDDHTSELEHLEKERYKANHDYLTGTFNRHGFYEEAKKILTEDSSTQRYLLVSNICNFKIINDQFGSQTGDDILIKHANLFLKSILDDKNISGRISADRFAYLISKERFTSAETQNQLKDLSSLIKDSNYELRVNVGIYEISNPFEDIESMYNKACLAIENASKDYENTIVYYNTDIMDNLKKEKYIVGEFPAALKNREFCMFLQPQVDTDGKVQGAEALVRWIKPEKGLVPPFEFIPHLEKTGYIHLLDEYIWEEAAKKLADWKSRGITDKHISVNISAKDFYYTDIYGCFTGLVEKYDINPKLLKLEITETVLMHDVQIHLQLISRLQAYGFSIEMDDFGSGYSSLNMLKDISVDVVKIDMGFLRKTENEQRAGIILKSIFLMTQKLKINTVCEGVETIEQVNNLKEMGCNLYQGYYFSKPIPVNEFEEKYFGLESL